MLPDESNNADGMRVGFNGWTGSYKYGYSSIGGVAV